jgi:hypothetical protein
MLQYLPYYKTFRAKAQERAGKVQTNFPPVGTLFS